MAANIEDPTENAIGEALRLLNDPTGAPADRQAVVAEAQVWALLAIASALHNQNSPAMPALADVMGEAMRQFGGS